MGKRRFAGAGDTLVFLMNRHDACVGSGVALNRGPGAVARTVVDHDGLETAERLPRDRFQTTVDVGFQIVNRNDYRNNRFRSLFTYHRSY